MIWFYSGTPGSGKSFHVSEDIYYSLKRGKYVIGNFPYFDEKIKDCKGTYLFLPNSCLDVGLLKFWFYTHHTKNEYGDAYPEKQTYLVIDECQKIFNVRNWNSKDRMGWIDFFSVHRKWGYEVILISQFDTSVDKQIRANFQTQILHHNLSYYGIPGRIASKLCGGNLFHKQTFNYENKKKVPFESGFFVGKKKFGELYRTGYLFDD